ncbi:MAG: LamG domain-containing protein [Planctomycetia bacterium]|nr:LamG domain-containing protein [Planctomycetia bacterium]
MSLGIFPGIVRADLVGLWTFEGETGLEMTEGTGHAGNWANLDAGEISVVDTTGTYVTRVYDASRDSYTYSFTPASSSKGGIITLGTLPELGLDNTSTTTASDFTISLWVKLDPSINYTGTGASYANSVILGDRNNAGDTSGYKFFKTMTGSTSYWTQGTGGNQLSFGTGLSNSTRDTWYFLTLTKSNGTLTSYLNGVRQSSGTTTGTMPALTLKLGGNGVKSETWYGQIDDVAVRNNAITASEVSAVYNALISSQGYSKKETFVKAQAAASGGKMVILDDFNANQTLTKGGIYTGSNMTWNVKEIGLENRAGSYTSNIQAAVVTDAAEYGNTNGILQIAGSFGSSTSTHWSGATLQSQETYTATEENPVLFSVNRLYMNHTGTAARSSIWLWNGTGKYVHFSQNTENSNGWTYNIGGTSWATGNGQRYGYTDDLNSHGMAIKYDGTNVWMYADGKLVGVDAANVGTFQVMLTGQSWGTSSTAEGTVDVGFDDPTVTTIAAVTSDIPISDTFSTMEVSSQWSRTSATDIYSKMTRTNPATGSTSTSTTVLGTGLLSIQGTNEATWGGRYDVNGLGIRVARDSMDFSSVDTEAGLKLANDAGTQVMTISQGDDGYWNLDWDGITVESINDLAVTGDSAELFLGDFFQTQILLESVAEGDDTRFTLQLDGNSYDILTSGWDGAVRASLYALGTGAYAGFDNFGLRGTEAPEPASWALLLLGLGLLFRRKK